MNSRNSLLKRFSTTREDQTTRHSSPMNQLESYMISKHKKNWQNWKKMIETRCPIYQNMNFMFRKRKEVVPLRPQFDIFQWICWFIWKERNDKLFNGKIVSRSTLFNMHPSEVECWKRTNGKEETNEDQKDFFLQRFF